MKLVASVIVRNERGRFLEPFVEHLLEFCDEIRCLDDASEDGSFELLSEQGVALAPLSLAGPQMFQHEGRARQALLDWTLAAEPTHILAIDADEFVSDGLELRRALEKPAQVWSLAMEEVWQAYDECVCIREDGGWRSHPVPICYAVPARLDASWRIAPRQLACGREPQAVARLARRALPSGCEVLHFGWAAEAEREARYERYRKADGGRFHAGSHLASIMAPDERTLLRGRPWPAALEPWREQILARCSGVAA